MLFDFTEAERNTARRALEIYVSELTDEIGKTERREWRESLRLEREILGRVIEQLSVWAEPDYGRAQSASRFAVAATGATHRVVVGYGRKPFAPRCHGLLQAPVFGKGIAAAVSDDEVVEEAQNPVHTPWPSKTREKSTVKPIDIERTPRWTPRVGRNAHIST